MGKFEYYMLAALFMIYAFLQKYYIHKKIIASSPILVFHQLMKLNHLWREPFYITQFFLLQLE